MKILKISLYIAILSFVLNFTWENTHAPLYEGFVGYYSHFQMCLEASIGDVFLILTMYFFISLILRKINWTESIKYKEFILIFIFGLIFTIIFEKYALLTGRWAYNENMPIIPLIGIGLSPVLQLIITPYLTFLLVGKYIKKQKPIS